jgi:hypothetical protein
VLIQWAWSYFTYGLGARIITEEMRSPPMQLSAERPPEEVSAAHR